MKVNTEIISRLKVGFCTKLTIILYLLQFLLTTALDTSIFNNYIAYRVQLINVCFHSIYKHL